MTDHTCIHRKEQKRKAQTQPCAANLTTLHAQSVTICCKEEAGEDVSRDMDPKQITHIIPNPEMDPGRKWFSTVPVQASNGPERKINVHASIKHLTALISWLRQINRASQTGSETSDQIWNLKVQMYQTITSSGDSDGYVMTSVHISRCSVSAAELSLCLSAVVTPRSGSEHSLGPCGLHCPQRGPCVEVCLGPAGHCRSCRV